MFRKCINKSEQKCYFIRKVWLYEISCMKEEVLAKISLNEIGFIFQQSNLIK